MWTIKIIILIGVLFNVLFANSSKVDISIRYKDKDGNLEHFENVNKNIMDGEYNATILYSPKMTQQDIKFEEKLIFTEEKLSLKPNDITNYKLDLKKPLSVREFRNIELLYDTSSLFSTLQNSVEYNIIFDKNGTKETVTFVERKLKLKLEIDLSEVSHVNKNKLYLIKRMLGLDFDDAWKISSLDETDLIQRRFSREITGKDIIEIYTSKNVKLQHVLFGVSQKKSKKVKDNFIVQGEYAEKTTHGQYNRYRFYMKEYLDHYFPNRKSIYLTELQIFSDKFKNVGIHKLRFLSDERVLNTEVYTKSQIINGLCRNEINLKKYIDRKINSINVRLLNKEKETITVENIELKIFSFAKVNVPIVLNKYFSTEFEIMTLKKLKKMQLNSKLYGDEGNLTIEAVLKRDKLFEFQDVEVSSDSLNDIFNQQKLHMKFEIIGSKLDFNTSISEYFNIESIVLEPNFNISKEQLKIIKNNVHDVKELENIVVRIFESGPEYKSLVRILILIMLFYFSVYIQQWVLNNFTLIGKTIYRGGGSICYSWAIVLWMLTAFFVVLGLEPIAEQISIMAFYFLIWGTIREVILLRKNKLD